NAAHKSGSRTRCGADGAHERTSRARRMASVACTSRSRTGCDARIDVLALDHALARHHQPVQGTLDRRRPESLVAERESSFGWCARCEVAARVAAPRRPPSGATIASRACGNADRAAGRHAQIAPYVGRLSVFPEPPTAAARSALSWPDGG